MSIDTIFAFVFFLSFCVTLILWRMSLKGYRILLDKYRRLLQRYDQLEGKYHRTFYDD
jgi:hypothetical protein